MLVDVLVRWFAISLGSVASLSTAEASNYRGVAAAVRFSLRDGCRSLVSRARMSLRTQPEGCGYMGGLYADLAPSTRNPHSPSFDRAQDDECGFLLKIAACRTVELARPRFLQRRARGLDDSLRITLRKAPTRRSTPKGRNLKDAATSAHCVADVVGAFVGADRFDRDDAVGLEV